MFINQVSENKVEKLVRNLKGKCSSGFDSVMDFIVKKCVQFIKKPLLISVILHLHQAFSQKY